MGQACKTLGTAALLQVHKGILLRYMGFVVIEEDVDNLHKATVLSLPFIKFMVQVQG